MGRPRNVVSCIELLHILRRIRQLLRDRIQEPEVSDSKMVKIEQQQMLTYYNKTCHGQGTKRF